MNFSLTNNLYLTCVEFYTVPLEHFFIKLLSRASRHGDKLQFGLHDFKRLITVGGSCFPPNITRLLRAASCITEEPAKSKPQFKNGFYFVYYKNNSP